MPLRARRCRSHVPFPIVVRLAVRSVRARELPVYFVEVVGLKHDAADDALSCRGFHPDFDFTEEDVEFCLDGRCVAAFRDGEFCAVFAVDDVPGGGVPGWASGGLGEVECVVRAHGDVSGAVCLVERVA